MKVTHPPKDSLVAVALTMMLVGVGFQAPAADRETDPFPITVSLGEELLHSISLRSNGPFTTASWVESNGSDPDQIHFLTFPDAHLDALPEVRTISAAGRSGIIHSPEMDLHPATSEPGFTWIGDGESGTRVYFATPGNDPTVVFSSEGAIEYPVIEYDGMGTAYLSWFETSGGNSRVYLARQDSNGGWGVFSVSEGEYSNDILPQLLGRDQGVDLYWFSILGGDTVTRKASYSPSQGLTESDPLLEHLPHNRWPVFYFPQGYDLLGALWLEQTAEGEIYFDLDPRSEGNPVASPVGDPTSNVSNVSVSEDPHAAKVWLESHPTTGKHLVAQRPGTDTEIRLEMNVPVFESVVSASTDWLNLLWLEEDPESGLLLLRFTRVQ
ncbi:MAG: hypothetical protein JJU11_13235 [Candidatus Sumerlaeia bacterium]|nr:hypothetical protein [Candidatus Sumerlaeia bacterium]